jgi:hypothetical protein
MGTKLIWSRRGTFELNDSFIEDSEVELLCMIFKDMIILYCEHDPMKGTLIYKALSPKFDSIPTGELTPEYRAEISVKRDDDGYVVLKELNWKRVPQIPSDVEQVLDILDNPSATADQKLELIKEQLKLSKSIIDLLKKTRAEKGKGDEQLPE